VKNTFILGVGAQKAGTTWLHQYLKLSPFFNPGLMKEYHIWDALCIDSCRGYLIKGNLEPRVDNVDLFPLGTAYREDILTLRGHIQSDSIPYEQYFAQLMYGEFNSTGDITPAYAGLQAHTYAQIKNRLESAGFKVKVVFLMRDPVERCTSAIRMRIRKRQSGDVAEILRVAYRSERISLRTNYHRTIIEVEKVFHPRDIYYGIYEEMFSAVNIEKLSQFCGVPTNLAAGSKMVNAGNDRAPIDFELAKEISDFYSEVYDFCGNRFPQTKLLWTERRNLSY
jgi:hypothetical protein